MIRAELDEALNISVQLKAYPRKRHILYIGKANFAKEAITNNMRLLMTRRKSSCYYILCSLLV